MSSSRSIAAARNRRAGEIANPQQRRPNTSINSHAAFAQPNMQRNITQQHMPNPNQNFRNQQQPPQFQQFQQQPPPQFQQQPNMSSQYEPENKQKKIILASQIPPNTKLSVSDAIGLITLRLGSVEQFIIDLKSEDNPVNKELPNNTTVIDNSVLTSIINRIDSLEKKEISNTVILNELNDFKNDYHKFTSFINEKFSYYDNMIQNINNNIEELYEKFNVFENISIDELQNVNEEQQLNEEEGHELNEEEGHKLKEEEGQELNKEEGQELNNEERQEEQQLNE